MASKLGVLTGAMAVCAFAVGCYSADFDEDADGAFYCSDDGDCESSKACDVFRCVDDTGPRLEITGPEALTPFAVGTSVQIVVQGTGLVLSEETAPGEGYLRYLLDGTEVAPQYVAGDLSEGTTPFNIDGDTLAAGHHRIEVQAYRGDDTRYENPSATAHRMFFVDDDQPHVGIVSPKPGDRHRVGEPLTVQIAAINYEWVADEPSGCSQAQIDDPEDLDCTMQDQLLKHGHTHVYSLADYPACLVDEQCNFQYDKSLRPQSVEEQDLLGRMITGVIDAEEYPDVGPLILSAGLQYNDHNPYPTEADVIFDQIELEVVP